MVKVCIRAAIIGIILGIILDIIGITIHDPIFWISTFGIGFVNGVIG